MNISLTPELESFIQKKVASGMYQTASEVIRDGLRLLKEQEELHQQKLDALRREIAKGLQHADEGKVEPLNAKETLAKMREKKKVPPKK